MTIIVCFFLWIEYRAASRLRPDKVDIQIDDLSSKPSDLTQKDKASARSDHRRQTIWLWLWMIVLTVVYIPPNILTAVFLANLSQLGKVWPYFQKRLEAHPKFWAVVQGVVAPTLQQAFYYLLPAIFRRLIKRNLIKPSEDVSNHKFQRERLVMNALYFFGLVNKLVVFSILSSAWAFIVPLLNSQQSNKWQALKNAHLGLNLINTLCGTSMYWLTWHLPNYVQAAQDLLQLDTLIFNFLAKRLGNPTPEDVIEMSAPKDFKYATSYNSCLFAATVGLAFGAIQPVILPVVALYFVLEAWSKEYLMRRVFFTKYESGGRFWPSVYNKFLVAVFLGDVVIAAVVAARGTWTMLFCMAPLLVIILGFKWYCARTYDSSFEDLRKSS